MRSEVVGVRLSLDEVAIVDEMRGEQSRSAFLRGLVRSSSPEGRGDLPTRDDVLRVLARMAEDGKVGAAVALERALRADAPANDEEVPAWLR